MSRRHGVMPPLPQYASMAWCLIKKKAQGHFYFLPSLKEIAQKIKGKPMSS
jgi:hypothetical protein